MCGGDSYIVTNKLGGMGPDVGQPPVIRYGKVASIEGMPIDLVPRPVLWWMELIPLKSDTTLTATPLDCDTTLTVTPP